MDDKRKPRKKAGPILSLLLLVLPVLYVLGSGPTFALMWSERIPEQAYRSAYGPLVRLAYLSGTNKILWWYCITCYALVPLPAGVERLNFGFSGDSDDPVEITNFDSSDSRQSV